MPSQGSCLVLKVLESLVRISFFPWLKSIVTGLVLRNALIHPSLGGKEAQQTTIWSEVCFSAQSRFMLQIIIIIIILQFSGGKFIDS